MQRIANRDAGAYVTRREEFKGSNLYAKWYDRGLYVVYSYGEHWPLYVYDNLGGGWYGNETKNSQSTGRHRAQARPNQYGWGIRDNITWVGERRIKQIVEQGVAATVAQILEGEPA